jgi:hypothetical protein
LINGKNTQIFVDRDLKNIHKIIESATQNNIEAHLKNLSVKMAEQLTKLLQARLVDNSTRSQETNELSNPSISSSSSINCIKCKNKYKTKSTYCTEGRHWVHYNCEKLSNKEIENVEQGQNSEYTCNICRNNKAKTSMIAIELPKKKISSNIDILGEGELRNDEVQDANRTNICHVCTAIIKTTFEICDLCNNSIHEDCCELTNSLTTCYACIGHTHINNQKDQSSNELENTVEQENTSAAI